MKRSIQIVVLIDALGWEFVKGRQFLNDMLPARMPLQTVLGFSSGAIPTILTGVPPARSGHWNLFYYDPKASPFWWVKYFSFLPDSLLDNRYTRKLLKEMGKHLFGLGRNFECCVSPRYLPYFNWLEKKNIYDRGGITGAPSIFDELASDGTPYRVYSYHHATDAEIVQQVRRDLERSNASFFFVYLSEMDMFLHMNCAHPDKIDAKLNWYDEQLRSIFKLAHGIDPEASFLICSDHGMTPVSEKHDLVADIENLGLKLCHDYLSVYDSTMARFWFFNDEARRRIIECLGKSACGRILSASELEALGLGFSDNRYGDLIFLLHPGWLIARSDFNGSGWQPAGMHGYHPDDRHSDAVFLSNRSPSCKMTNIADIHSVMKEMQRRAALAEAGAR